MAEDGKGFGDVQRFPSLRGTPATEETDLPVVVARRPDDRVGDSKPDPGPAESEGPLA